MNFHDTDRDGPLDDGMMRVAKPCPARFHFLVVWSCKAVAGGWRYGSGEVVFLCL